MQAIQLAGDYYVAQVGLVAQIDLYAVKLIEGQNPTDIETQLDAAVSSGLENLKDQPTIYFAAHHTYLLLYALTDQKEKVASLVGTFLTGFGAKFIVWVLPNVAHGWWIVILKPPLSTLNML